MIPEPYPREIGYANRSLLLLRPRPPMIDWVQACDPDDPAATLDVARATEAIMIPPFETKGDAREWVEENADILFEVALGSWCSDPELWPEPRDWSTLQEWFDVELVAVLWDVVDAPLASDPDELYVDSDEFAPEELPEVGPLDPVSGGEGEWN